MAPALPGIDYVSPTFLENELSAKADTKDLASHTSDTTKHITSSERTTWNGKANTVTYTASIPVSWTADSTNGGYTQTVSVSGITVNDNPIADVVLGSDIEANKLYLAAWANITRITTDNGSITLYANDAAPETAFTVQLKVVR